MKELAKAGHDVTAIYRSHKENYSGIRLARIKQVEGSCRQVFNCPFGKAPFFSLIKEQPWNLFCHHAADVTDYKSPAFNAIAALENNTLNLKESLTLLKEQGCHHVVLTGSIFEQREGIFSKDDRAVSPYGLSKGLTADFFAYYTALLNLHMAKFVIPNPFGPFEEKRFTTYLIDSWYAGIIPEVGTPLYIRDNVPTSLLAKMYVDFAINFTKGGGSLKLNPSFYAESQKEFTCRFAREMGARLPIKCPFTIKNQTEFPEPIRRINFDYPNVKALGFSEEVFWDELAQYYATKSCALFK